MNKALALLLATRPKTLPAIIVPVVAGCMIVWRYQQIDPAEKIQLNIPLAIATLLSALFIQIACNFFNDALDAKKNADTSKRQGPKRMTASGALSPRTVQIVALLFLVASAIAAYPLLMERGYSMLIIGIPSMLLAYAYTGGPWPLAYKGLGEVFVLLFFGLIAVAGTVYVQLGWEPIFTQLYGAAFIVGIQFGLLSCVLLEINNIRDRKEDESTGKRTLAVRMGDARARRLAIAFIIAPYVTLKQTAFFLPGLSISSYWIPPLILGGLLIMKIRKTPADKRMNPLLAIASLHMILFLTALCLS